MSLISLQEAKYKASKLHSRESSGECLVIKQEKIKPLTLNEIFDTCFDEAYTLPADKKSQEYDRAFRRKRDAKKHIYKWILDKIGNEDFANISKKTIIDAFLNTEKAPSKDTMHKNLAVLTNVLKAAKRKQLIEHYNFLELAKKELNIVMLHVTQSSIDMAYFMEAAKQSEILEVLQFWGDKIESLGLDIDYLEKQCSVF